MSSCCCYIITMTISLIQLFPFVNFHYQDNLERYNNNIDTWCRIGRMWSIFKLQLPDNANRRQVDSSRCSRDTKRRPFTRVRSRYFMSTDGGCGLS